jgi:hypothetical protein
MLISHSNRVIRSCPTIPDPRSVSSGVFLFSILQNKFFATILIRRNSASVQLSGSCAYSYVDFWRKGFVRCILHGSSFVRSTVHGAALRNFASINCRCVIDVIQVIAVAVYMLGRTFGTGVKRAALPSGRNLPGKCIGVTDTPRHGRHTVTDHDCSQLP